MDWGEEGCAGGHFGYLDVGFDVWILDNEGVGYEEGRDLYRV